MKSPVFQIFCDESRQSKDRFMILGGIILPQENIDEFNSTMEAFRTKHNMHAELKWSKVSNQKINEYKAFVDYFFALNNTDKIHFHSLIIDNHKVNHKKYNKGNKELGFYKFYYQLLLHSFGKEYSKHNARLIVTLDHRTTSYKLSTLLLVLNKGIKKRYNIDYSPFVSVEPKDSKKSQLLQINDIIIGAVGFQKNGYHLLSNSKKAKIELAQYIADKAGLNDLLENTWREQKRFTIWNFKLTK